MPRRWRPLSTSSATARRLEATLPVEARGRTADRRCARLCTGSCSEGGRNRPPTNREAARSSRNVSMVIASRSLSRGAASAAALRVSATRRARDRLQSGRAVSACQSVTIWRGRVSAARLKRGESFGDPAVSVHDVGLVPTRPTEFSATSRDTSASPSLNLAPRRPSGDHGTSFAPETIAVRGNKHDRKRQMFRTIDASASCPAAHNGLVGGSNWLCRG